MDLTTAIVSGEYARALNRYAREAGCTVKGHIKIDSGMSRLGIVDHHPDQLGQAVAEAEEMLSCERLEIDGIFTHFATSGWKDTEFTDMQFRNFKAVLDALTRKGYHLPRAHCCNSGAVAFHPECELQTVRSGSLLYGFQPDPTRPVAGLRSPISLKSCVEKSQLERGDKIGYNCTYEVQGSMTIAVVPIGYADGLPYGMSNQGCILVNGKRAPVVGTICMDQMMVDITGIEGVRPGQTVTVFGEDNDEMLPGGRAVFLHRRLPAPVPDQYHGLRAESLFQRRRLGGLRGPRLSRLQGQRAARRAPDSLFPRKRRPAAKKGRPPPALSRRTHGRTGGFAAGAVPRTAGTGRAVGRGLPQRCPSRPGQGHRRFADISRPAEIRHRCIRWNAGE